MNEERKIPSRYLPKSLTPSDRRKQLRSIREKRDRPQVSSFKSKRSNWTRMANSYFGDGNTSKIDMAKILSKGNKKRQKELMKGFDEIFKKGEGAYYSSGSRPNQTPQSWAYGRLFSVLFGGKSRNIDKNIVEKYKIPLLFKKKQTKNRDSRRNVIIGKGNKPGDDCPICLEKMNPYTQMLAVSHPNNKEKHYFHFDCLKRHITSSGDYKCPLCRENIYHKRLPNGKITLFGQYPRQPPPPRHPPPRRTYKSTEQKGKGLSINDIILSNDFKY